MLIGGVWEETGYSDTRLLEAMILPDVLTVAGFSAAAEEASMRREHVVPRIFIIDECKRMLRVGEPDAAIAGLINHNTKIVYVSPSQQKILDSKYHLNLSRKMPDGWKFGDDIFARLSKAKIEWYPCSRMGIW